MRAIQAAGEPTHSYDPGARARERGNAYPLLDLLRFGAALLVMLSHLRDQFFAPYSETRCASTIFRTVFFFSTRLGLESVLLFFVLSGFLVGGMSVEKSLTGQFSPVKYVIDRFTRIYTPLVPVLLFALVVCKMSGIGFSWGNFWVNLCSLQGVLGDPFPALGALWSLSYEVWFYILFGALICLVRPGSRRLKVVLLLLVFLSGLVFSRLMTAYLFVWVTGMASYFIKPPGRRWLFLSAAVGIVAIGTALMQVTSITTQADFSRFHFIDHSVAILVLGLGLALLMPLAAGVRFTSRRGARVAKAGSFLAGFSYSLYLLHLPMEQVLLDMGVLQQHRVLNSATLTGYFGMAAGMLFASYGFYFCFERQTPLLRKWLQGLVARG